MSSLSIITPLSCSRYVSMFRLLLLDVLIATAATALEFGYHTFVHDRVCVLWQVWCYRSYAADQLTDYVACNISMFYFFIFSHQAIPFRDASLHSS
uniref:Uncharacterized protein n=1 Tax=Anopheles darlingi TaxID=43151 RepID=A0A2M4D4L9_ANODA